MSEFTLIPTKFDAQSKKKHKTRLLDDSRILRSLE
jgi:hypothetical protein